MNKLNLNKQAFTLVELIVTITILAILATIAFISFTGYSQNSRDSKRIADINSIQKSLELYITEKGTYPIPDNNASITYSGGTAWIEGTVGDAVIRNLDKINKKPLDPLTENEYTYSVTSSKTEYQIGAITEGGTIGYKLPISQTHAATEKKATAMVRGTYNERFLRVQSGTLNWILAIPSIIATDITQTNVQTILDNNKLVYNNYQNIPHSYNNAGYTMTGGFNYTNTNPLIYSGSLKYLTESNTGKLDFITKLKAAYYGTILHGEANYQDIVNADLSNQTGSIYLVNRFINTNLGGIKVSNIILPTTDISTNTEPNPYANCTDQNIPTPFSATTTYSGCNDADIIVCSGLGTGYTIASCNVGSTIAGTSSGSYGKYFQWGRNKGFVYLNTSQQSTRISGTIGLDAGTDTYGFVWNGSLVSPYTWANSDIENNWGNTTNSSIARQGPCASGYHVPTQSEWVGIHTAGQWGTNGSNMIIALKLPKAGNRTRFDGTFINQGDYGLYWSSSPNGTNAYRLAYTSSGINPNNDNNRAYGCSVRCIKN